MPEGPGTRQGSERLRGVASWDTFPPAAGRIHFRSASHEVLATGRFRVILSYGPGERYTMAWAIDAYRQLGIPVVPRGFRTDAATYEPATREGALAHGDELIAETADAVAFWAGDLLLEVTNVRPPSEDLGHANVRPPPLPVPFPPEPVTDRALGDAEKLAVLRTLEPLGLRDELRTALIFVLEDHQQEIELSRNDVTAGDVDVLARAYWMMPTWAQRAGVVYLLQDSGSDELVDVWFDILRAPDHGAGSATHVAKSAALARLRGDIASMERYLDDHELMRVHARIWSQVRGTTR